MRRRLQRRLASRDIMQLHAAAASEGETGITDRFYCCAYKVGLKLSSLRIRAELRNCPFFICQRSGAHCHAHPYSHTRLPTRTHTYIYTYTHIHTHAPNVRSRLLTK